MNFYIITIFSAYLGSIVFWVINTRKFVSTFLRNDQKCMRAKHFLEIKSSQMKDIVFLQTFRGEERDKRAIFLKRRCLIRGTNGSQSHTESFSITFTMALLNSHSDHIFSLNIHSLGL